MKLAQNSIDCQIVNFYIALYVRELKKRYYVNPCCGDDTCFYIVNIVLNTFSKRFALDLS